MRLFWGIVILAACGQVEKARPDAKQFLDAPIDSPSDAAPDAPIDAPALGVPANPALWLKMDDTPTDGALDSAASPHTATCASCPTVVTGQVASGYKFTTNRIDVAAAADLGPNTAFTIAAWVRLDTAPNSNVMVIACKNQGTLDCTYGLLVENNAAPGFYSQGGAHLMGTTPMTVGTWYHLAMTWDGATKTGYVNGAVNGSAALAAPANDATTPLSIGDRTGTSSLPLQATVDQLLFYDRALSAAEVASLAQP